MHRSLLLAGLLLMGFAACRTSPKPGPEAAPAEPKAPTLETVHEFQGPMPTGVTVSREGRVFVNFPRWGDAVPATVVELSNGQEVPYPSAELNNPDSPNNLVSVQSVVVDPRNRLWALDTGSINMAPIPNPNWPKLVGIDLTSNQVFRVIRFPANVVPSTSYLNDVRFDLRRGEDGMAFITDSSGGGPNAIIVVDLASGRSWRKLNEHPAVKADKDFVGKVHGEPVQLRLPGQPPKPLRVGADGIALNADGSRLYFCALASRALHSVSVDALADEKLPDAEVAKTLRTEEREFASDGLEADAQGRLYLTDWEHDAIVVRPPEGTFQTLITDPRLSWPDTLSLASDGYLYVIANQLHQQARFHGGQDLRKKPYLLLRLKTDGTPVALTK
ncbi:L-dopachrome tautomerase-related protein [Myxococcaceae bacterium GXIMD 01537]